LAKLTLSARPLIDWLFREIALRAALASEKVAYPKPLDSPSFAKIFRK
jgi:hypothetical protein